MSVPAHQSSVPPIDGAALLDQVERFHRRFNVFPVKPPTSRSRCGTRTRT